MKWLKKLLYGAAYDCRTPNPKVWARSNHQVVSAVDIQLDTHRQCAETQPYLADNRWFTFKSMKAWPRGGWPDSTGVMIRPLEARSDYLCAIGGEYVYDPDGNPVIDRCIPVLLGNYRIVDV